MLGIRLLVLPTTVSVQFSRHWWEKAIPSGLHSLFTHYPIGCMVVHGERGAGPVCCAGVSCLSAYYSTVPVDRIFICTVIIKISDLGPQPISMATTKHIAKFMNFEMFGSLYSPSIS